QVHVLIEDLDSVVVAVADVETSFEVERQGVRLIEFTGAVPELAPRCGVLTGLVELPHHLRAARVVVPLRHIDAAVRSVDHVVWLEAVLAELPPCLAERHQRLARWAELEHLMTFGRAAPGAWWRRRAASRRSCSGLRGRRGCRSAAAYRTTACR